MLSSTKKVVLNLQKVAFICQLKSPLQVLLLKVVPIPIPKSIFLIFCQCYQNYLRHLWLISFNFQMSGRWFPGHLKGGGGYTPNKSRGVFFRYIGQGN